MITQDTRLESYLKLDAQPRKRKIVLALMDKSMTAREISYKLGYSDLNAVKPRLTELVNEGIVEVVTTKKDSVTGRRVAVYEVRT